MYLGEHDLHTRSKVQPVIRKYATKYPKKIGQSTQPGAYQKGRGSKGVSAPGGKNE